MLNWCTQCNETSSANEELFMYKYQGNNKRRSIIPQNKVNQNINNVRQHFEIYSKSKYDENLQECIKSQKNFEDDSFRMDLSSLEKLSYRKLGVNRLKNLANGSLFIPQANRTILDLKKNDSYFLSSLQAIATSNQNILRILDGTTNVNQFGIYKLNILANGKPKQFIIDDQIPVFKDNSQRLLFTNVKDGLLWIILVEKAYAKLCGGYDKILQGSCHEIFNIFTLAPSLILEIPLKFSQKNQQEIWSTITQAIKNNFPITCTSRNSKTCIGIIPHKVYPIIDCSVNVETSKRIVRLMNITKDLQHIEDNSIEYQKKGQIVRIQLKDFIRNFLLIDVAHIRPNYNSHFYSFEALPENMFFYKFQLNQEVNFYLTLQRANNKQGRLRMIVARVVENKNYEYEFVNGRIQQNYSDLTLRLNLSRGQYIILCESTVKSQCCLRVYCQIPLILQEYRQGFKFLQHIFYDLALKSQNQWQEVGQNRKDWICSKSLFEELGLGFVIISLDKNSQYKCRAEHLNNKSNKYRLINKKQKNYVKEIIFGDIQILIFQLLDRNAESCEFPPDSLSLKKMI